jgi:tRNA(Ile)-lysidine synthetase-like protein
MDEDPKSITLCPLPFTLNPLPEKMLHSFATLGVSKDSKLLIAVSGGPDSLALLHVVQSLREMGAFVSMAVAHVNHLLREPASDTEEESVRRYCESWNVPFFLKRVQTTLVSENQKTGIEETARKLRYDFFEALAETHRFDFVLTAHTANDQAETVILNMIRGAGARGLAGIPPKRKLARAYIIRPWLDVTKVEIMNYLQEHNLAAEHDTSNDELTYQRNRVRHKVMPVLAEVWPDRSPVKSLAALAERMRELSNFLDKLSREELRKLEMDGGLSIEGITVKSGFLLHAIIEAWIHQEFGHYGLTSEETSRIGMWLASVSPRMELRRGLSFRKDGPVLRLESDGRQMTYPT